MLLHVSIGRLFISISVLVGVISFENTIAFNVNSAITSGNAFLGHGRSTLKNKSTRTTLFSSTLGNKIKSDGVRTSVQNGMNSESSNDNPLPFIVESVSPTSKVNVFEEITYLCIDVFFNEEAEKKVEERNKGKNSLWKEFLLGYLRKLQTGDLKTRTFEFNRGVANEMFVARKVLPLPESSTFEDANPINSNDIFNIQALKGVSRFRRGEIIGFVDITEKTIGFGEVLENELIDINVEITDSDSKMRPVLTNLAVKEEARKSGVGSRLVEACESAVLSWSPPMASREHSELVLQVEESNINAQAFYEKKGYKVLFADPSCRRLDSSGFLLKKVRTTKICFRKDLNLSRASGIDVFSIAGLDKLIASSTNFLRNFR
uniref:N-acetyltransferase domain-containing protein n=1 Tax=Eucampia antarctica TaxID=49252 RepID=A0A7S2SL13_9STRA|mmetsp:Transcript_9804/g.9464  ORF Transcript_9804/g.9464 Transcript_9804/m.9464 type:complete len:376 (+) Transcript_9804:62-1189(+)